MALRRVTHSKKNSDGDIVAICNKVTSYMAPNNWRYVTKSIAVEHIENSEHRYYVNKAGFRTDVVVKYRYGVPYLTTEADASSANNLDNLGNCS
ncbi:MAG: DUF3892 domain-containing protein [Bacteroidota bacterium]